MRDWVFKTVRLVAAAVLFSCSLIGVRSAARADCGMHLFETGSVPYLRSLDALPLTPANVMHTPDRSAPDLPFPATLGVPACSDEPALRNQTASALLQFWRFALADRALLAALRFDLAGGTNMPPGCAAYERAAARAQVANDFAFVAPRSLYTDAWKTLWASMRASPHFAHAEAIWRDNFARAGFVYRGVTTNDTYAWSRPYGTAAQAAHDHLPSGIFCHGNASLYTYTASAGAPGATTP